MSKRTKACAVVDDKQEIHCPLDFSFKAINMFHGMRSERRKGGVLAIQ